MRYTYIQVIDDNLIELNINDSFHAKDAIHPGMILGVWSEDELKEIGVYKVEQHDAPAGKDIKAVSYKLDGDKVVEVLDLVDVKMKLKVPPQLTQSYEGPGQKTKYKSHIDERAVCLREDFMSKGMYPVYEAKRREAEKFLAKRPTKTKPSLKNYPYLKAAVESKIDGDNATEIATIWRTMAQQTDEMLAVIEAKRLKAKALINDASSTEEMEKIVYDFNVQ